MKHNRAPILIEEWKGDDIATFQEDLLTKVKARVSEKWFYTYFKNEANKLPRIDMLNLLSDYVGFKDWNTFKASHIKDVKKKKTINTKILYGTVLISIIITSLIFINSTKNEFHFCFVDHAKNAPITKIPLDIKILQDNESPLYFKTDSLGCFTYQSKNDYIKLVVQSPYHKTDTIIRFIDSNSNKIIKLLPDDYALMLRYYTNGNIKDWKKHKEQLNNLIADDAQIYQIFENNIGIELFSKSDFIRLITIPTSTLKRIEILDRKTINGKIVKLKFIVK
ncbi:hypothetical protein [uncultured Algibacter sp.]|uniref:hypothetical protein n=1 Tax=uncultured Algibacter sp. TaxID=298659 RepID=UPI003216D5A2